MTLATYIEENIAWVNEMGRTTYLLVRSESNDAIWKLRIADHGMNPSRDEDYNSTISIIPAESSSFCGHSNNNEFRYETTEDAIESVDFYDLSHFYKNGEWVPFS